MMAERYKPARQGVPTRRCASFSATYLPLALLMGLAACNGSDSETGPGAVSEGEAAALDDAAEMLDARQLPPEALPEAGSPTTDETTAPTEVTDDSG